MSNRKENVKGQQIVEGSSVEQEGECEWDDQVVKVSNVEHEWECDGDDKMVKWSSVEQEEGNTIKWEVN